MKALWSELNKKEQTRLMLLVGMLTAAVLSLVPNLAETNWLEKNCNCLTVSFLDVGQGDAILIKTPDGFEALIDGGADTSVLRALGKERSFFDKDIDLVVATHPDADHIGGLVHVLKRFAVDTILETEAVNETPVAAAYEATMKEEEAEVILAESGQVLLLGASTTLRVFSPTGDEREWESNTASIVLQVQYGSTTFMLSGDAPSEIENYLVETYGTQLDSDVLKLGHHGSKTSTSEAWLDAVSPRFAVVSAGLDNRYGHPHQDVMQRVFKRNIQTSHTGTDGTIIFQSDGQTVWQSK